MEKLKNRITPLKATSVGSVFRNIGIQAAYFISAFLFGGISFAGGLSPFATGFAGGTDINYVIFSSLGAAAGYVVFFGLFDSLRFVGSTVIICILKLFLQPKADFTYQNHMIAGITGLGSFAVSLCIYLAVPGEGIFLIMCFSESLISAAFAVFSRRVYDITTEKRKSIFCNPSDIVAVFFTGSIILLALDRFSVYGFSPARIIAYIAIQLLALYGGQTAAAITGICCGLTLGFSDAQPQLMPTFILSGVLSGITGSFGKIPVAISLILSSALALILKGEPATALIALGEAAFSAAVFILIPKFIMTGISEVLLSLRSDFSGEERLQTLHFMLKRTGKVIKDIAGSVGAVSEFLQKSDAPSYDSIPLAVKEDICKACNKYNFCWIKCGDISGKAFSEANERLKKNEMLLTEDLPERLSLICRMPDKITQGFNKAYLEQCARILARNDIFEAKKAAARQFSCIGALIDATAENIKSIPATNNGQASALTPLFTEMGFEITGISEYTAPSENSILQVYCSHVPAIPDKSQLLEKIYEATGRVYLPPVIDSYAENGTVLSFTEEGRFRVSCHTASHTGAGEQFSGDTLRSFPDGKGCFYVVLSDGMGSGTRAAIDSVMTANLMSQLLRADFSPENALETVNCALLIKSAEETLATLDILKIDLNSGKAEFFKAGACFSVIGKSEKTAIVEKSSMPLGILESTTFEKTGTELSRGDTVIILSDGASTIPHTRFREIIKENRNEGTKVLSEAIVNEALSLSPSGKHDDITVCCVQLK